jgi:hypothetical protein
LTLLERSISQLKQENADQFSQIETMEATYQLQIYQFQQSIQQLSNQTQKDELEALN